MQKYRHDEMIKEGESMGLTKDEKEFIFNTAIKTFHQIGSLEDFSEKTYTKRTQYMSNVLSQEFGGDWICISGKRIN